LHFDGGGDGVFGKDERLCLVYAPITIFTDARTHASKTRGYANEGEEKSLVYFSDIVLLHQRGTMQKGEHGNVMYVVEELVKSAPN
jgi:hypothetical protein